MADITIKGKKISVRKVLDDNKKFFELILEGLEGDELDDDIVNEINEKLNSNHWLTDRENWFISTREPIFNNSATITIRHLSESNVSEDFDQPFRINEVYEHIIKVLEQDYPNPTKKAALSSSDDNNNNNLKQEKSEDSAKGIPPIEEVSAMTNQKILFSENSVSKSIEIAGTEFKIESYELIHDLSKPEQINQIIIELKSNNVADETVRKATTAFTEKSSNAYQLLPSFDMKTITLKLQKKNRTHFTRDETIPALNSICTSLEKEFPLKHIEEKLVIGTESISDNNNGMEDEVKTSVTKVTSKMETATSTSTVFQEKSTSNPGDSNSKKEEIVDESINRHKKEGPLVLTVDNVVFFLQRDQRYPSVLVLGADNLTDEICKKIANAINEVTTCYADVDYSPFLSVSFLSIYKGQIKKTGQAFADENETIAAFENLKTKSKEISKFTKNVIFITDPKEDPITVVKIENTDSKNSNKKNFGEKFSNWFKEKLNPITFLKFLRKQITGHPIRTGIAVLLLLAAIVLFVILPLFAPAAIPFLATLAPLLVKALGIGLPAASAIIGAGASIVAVTLPLWLGKLSQMVGAILQNVTNFLAIPSELWMQEMNNQFPAKNDYPNNFFASKVPGFILSLFGVLPLVYAIGTGLRNFGELLFNGEVEKPAKKFSTWMEFHIKKPSSEFATGVAQTTESFKSSFARMIGIKPSYVGLAVPVNQDEKEVTCITQFKRIFRDPVDDGVKLIADLTGVEYDQVNDANNYKGLGKD